MDHGICPQFSLPFPSSPAPSILGVRARWWVGFCSLSAALNSQANVYLSHYAVGLGIWGPPAQPERGGRGEEGYSQAPEKGERSWRLWRHPNSHTQLGWVGERKRPAMRPPPSACHSRQVPFLSELQLSYLALRGQATALHSGLGTRLVNLSPGTRGGHSSVLCQLWFRKMQGTGTYQAKTRHDEHGLLHAGPAGKASSVAETTARRRTREGCVQKQGVAMLTGAAVGKDTSRGMAGGLLRFVSRL